MTDIVGNAVGVVGVMKYRRHCRVGETGPEGPCKTWTKLALLVPCAFEDDERGPGVAAVPVCANHLYDAVVSIAQAQAET